MRLQETIVAKKPLKEDELAQHAATFEGVPQAVVDSFLQGLDDVKHGRTISVDEALAESHRKIQTYRANKKNNKNVSISQQRKPTVPETD